MAQQATWWDKNMDLLFGPNKPASPATQGTSGKAYSPGNATLGTGTKATITAQELATLQSMARKDPALAAELANLNSKSNKTDGTNNATAGKPPLYKPDKNKDKGGGGSGKGGGSGSSTSSAGTGTAPTGKSKNKLYTAQELADLFGFTFGQDEIEKILADASNAKFDEMDKQTAQLRDRALTDYSSAYKQYNDQSRQNRGRAMKNGLSRGSNIAQEVLSQVQAQQGGAFNQQQYQQQLGDLVAQRGSQLASDKFTAMNTQNQLAGQLGTMSVNQYSNNVQEDAAYMAYLGQMAQAEAQKAVAGATTQSAGIYAAAQNNATNASASGANTMIKSLVDQGMPNYLAQMVGYGVMDYATANAAWQKTKPAAPTPTYNAQAPRKLM